MLRIYHAPGTRSLRVIWLCEELSLPYEIVRVDFTPQFRASPEFRRLNPVGKIPVLEVDHFTLFESGAIVQHILDWHSPSPLEPERGTHEHALYMQWSWFAEATFARPIGEMITHKRAFPGAEVPAVLDEMRKRAMLSCEAVDAAVARQDYLVATGFTAADVMMGYTLMLYARFVDENMPANVARYWSRLKERPAFKATMAANNG